MRRWLVVVGALAIAVLGVQPAGASSVGPRWKRLLPADRPFPSIAAGGAMAPDGTGGIIFHGMEDDADQTWRWDGTTWTHLDTGHADDLESCGGSMAFDARRQRIVWVSGCGLFEWVDGHWTAVGDVSALPARGGAVAYDDDLGRVVLFGGYRSDGSLSDETWAFDGSTWTQITTAQRPVARTDGALAFDAAHHQLVLFGGSGSSGLRTDTWTFDGVDWTRQDPPLKPSMRTGHAMAYDPVRQVVVMFGGSYGRIYAPPTRDDTWQWDGSRWTRIDTKQHPTKRALHVMAWDAVNGKVLFFGGTEGLLFDDNVNDTWLFG